MCQPPVFGQAVPSLPDLCLAVWTTGSPISAVFQSLSNGHLQSESYLTLGYHLALLAPHSLLVETLSLLSGILIFLWLVFCLHDYFSQYHLTTPLVQPDQYMFSPHKSVLVFFLFTHSHRVTNYCSSFKPENIRMTYDFQCQNRESLKEQWFAYPPTQIFVPLVSSTIWMSNTLKFIFQPRPLFYLISSCVLDISVWMFPPTPKYLLRSLTQDTLQHLSSCPIHHREMIPDSSISLNSHIQLIDKF